VSTAFAVLVLLFSISLLCLRRTETALWVCAAQGLCATGALAAYGSLVAPVALLLNAAAVPLALQRLLADRLPDPPPPRLWLLAIGVLLVTAFGFGMLGNGIASGVAVVLLGLLLAARGAAPIGLLSAQNGVVLVAAAIPDLPPESMLFATLPLLPALLLAHAWLRQ
jgi:hypothetical protein